MHTFGVICNWNNNSSQAVYTVSNCDLSIQSRWRITSHGSSNFSLHWTTWCCTTQAPFLKPTPFPQWFPISVHVYLPATVFRHFTKKDIFISCNWGDICQHRDIHDGVILLVYIYIYVFVHITVVLRNFIIFVHKLLKFGIQIKYRLPYCVAASMRKDLRFLNPGVGRSRVPGWWNPGIRTNTRAGYRILANDTLFVL